MADKYELEHIVFNNEDLIVLRRVVDVQLGEVIQCMSDNGVIYINNNEIITNKEIIDKLDEQYWRTSKVKGLIEKNKPKHRSIRDLNKQTDMER